MAPAASGRVRISVKHQGVAAALERLQPVERTIFVTQAIVVLMSSPEARSQWADHIGADIVENILPRSALASLRSAPAAASPQGNLEPGETPVHESPAPEPDMSFLGEFN